MKNLIYFVGKAGAGKSTATDVLVDLGYTRYSFADPLRDMLRGLLGEEHPALERGADKTKPLPELGGKSVRQALQTLGTEWGREMVWEDIWLYAMRWRLEMAGDDELIVIDDARFQNEVNLLDGLGGFGIFVERPGVQGVGVHVSEDLALSYAPYADLILTNDFKRQRDFEDYIERFYLEWTHS